jgi:5-methyltetrahydropteroyltriglutamate--homocysteine methyltransferase
VTTKRSDLEPLDLLRRRVDDASKHLAVEQLALSPQCGFGGLDHIVIPEADQWRKFERILEAAHAIWS